MGKVYPHLHDATAFPGNSPVEPYAQYRNVFDYDRWTPGTRLRLLSVPWDDSRNIVEWSREERDAWMEAHAVESTTLNSMFNITPDLSVKVPFTVDTVNRCNYLWVQRPVGTADDMPLDSEIPDRRVDAYGYFITGAHYEAPSTTRLDLELDVFTTYRPYITFTYCQLERGHAPVSVTNVDDYLENPAANNTYLLCDDVNYGGDDMTVRGSRFVPFGEGVKCVMFASVMSPDMLTGLTEAKAWAGAATPPTYEDTADRWGYQYKVNGYAWNYGDRDYSDASTPVDTMVGDLVPNGYHMYMVEGADAYAFFRDVVDRVPQMMGGIVAMWMIAADMVETTGTITVAGHTVNVVASLGQLPDIAVKLTRDMFGYEGDYAELAKLYTSPYSDLHVSDNDGNDITIRIETLGEQVALHRRVSLAYPYLKAQSFLTGVNGYGTAAYSWTRLDGTETDCDAFDTQWADYMTSFDIPTYSLTFSGYVDWAYRNQRASLAMERLKALNTYHVTDRNVNTAYENAVDSQDTALGNANRSADTAYSNAVLNADNAQTTTNDTGDTMRANTNRAIETARTNAGRTNATNRDNANDSAATAQANGNASALTAQTNGNAAAVTAHDNTYATLDTTEENAGRDRATNTANATLRTGANSANLTERQTAELNALSWNNTLSDGMTDRTNDLNALGTQLENDNAATSFTASALGGIASGVATGGVPGGVAAAIGSVTNGLSLGNVMTNKTAYTQSAIDMNTINNQDTQSQNGLILEGNQQAATNITNNENDVITQSVTNSNNTQKTNIEETVKTGKSNADSTRDTTTANNARAYNTAVGNNARSYNTAVGNAQRSYETAEANAEANRQTGLTNSEQTNQVIHRNSQRNRDTAVTTAAASRDTAKTNAGDTCDTAKNNALETREAQVFAAKTALEQAQDVTRLSYGQHGTDKPVRAADASGDPTPDIFAYRGTQFRVRTQPDGAIRMAGDQFLRYGYRWEGAWDIGTLNVMPRFSYWQASELWFDATTTILENARREIRDLFTNGVTVWANPDDIGKVGIHGNK